MVEFARHPVDSLDGRWLMRHALADLGITDWAAFHAPDADVIPAQVPGHFELDLHAAGRVPDPFVGLNMQSLYPLERHHVWYARQFEATPRPGHEPTLVCHGSDCYARYYLNGQLIGESDNALVEHQLAVGGALRQGVNTLVVHFRPALLEAARYDYPAHLEAFAVNYEGLHVRKAAHSFGWDIMPRALGAGLWRSVELRWRPACRLDEVYLETLRCSADQATLRLFYKGTFDAHDGATYEIDLQGQGSGSSFALRRRAFFLAGQLVVKLASPQLWWPRGRGEPHLYDVAVRLLRDGQEVDRATFRHGIRQVELRRTSVTNAQGEGDFRFIVNGQPFFAMGTNHVPLDAYHARDLAHLDAYMAMVDDLGCNMLRCWGGNVYEHDRFYDLCDEKGVLVWQDFALACGWYPQDEGFQKRLADEAVKVVRRLRQHACIALWAGDNECDSSGHRASRPTHDPNNNVLTRQVLPRVLAAHDPGRVYLPSSPYIDATARGRGLDVLPEHHPWGPRDYFKSDYYRQVVCHFASEMGYHGCPAPDSIARFIDADHLWPCDNDQWLLHASTPWPGQGLYDYRVPLMATQVAALFGSSPDDLDRFAWQSQCVQAEAKKFFIELFRTGKWRRTGILWWNLRDGWPQFSDAVVDYYNQRKLAYDFIRTAQSPLLLTFREPVDGRLELVACHDRPTDTPLHYTVTDARDGQVVLAGQAVAQADAVTPLDTLAYDPSQQTMYWIDWRPVGQAASDASCGGVNHYLAGQPPFDAVQYTAWLAQRRPLEPWQRAAGCVAQGQEVVS